MPTVHVRSLDDTRELGAALARLLKPGDVIVLSGDLGAGKTAFTQALGAALGVTAIITSPTFALVQPYEGTRMRLYHLDVYRLNHHSEVEDLGLVEILDDIAVAVIEWGERILDALPASRLEIEITPQSDEGRTFELLPRGADWTNRVAALRLPEAMGSGAC